MRKSYNFTEGPILRSLISFSLPVLAALLLQTMYGAVDLLIVGQFGGELADVFVSAVSTGSQVMHTATVVITGISMGLTVYVGKKIGAGEKEEAGRIIGSGIVLFAALSLVLTVLMVIFAPQLSMLMKAPEEAFEQTVAYVAICSAGSIFIVSYNLIGSIFRGMGDSKVPLFTVAVACVLNIFGDLLFVAVFGLGAAGAAIATIIAQAVSVVLSLLIIRKRQLPFSFTKSSLIPDFSHIRTILGLGVPIAFQDLLVSVSFLFITAIVNGIGLTASAGVGVAERLCGFLMLVPSAYMQSMSAFVAQNIGAKKPERARKALFCGIASSFVSGVIMWYATFFHGEALSGIFARDMSIISASADYLRAYGIDCLLVAFLFCFIGYFNGCGNTTFVMLQGIIGAFGVRLPVSYVMSRLEPVSLFRVGLATPASTTVQIILCMAVFAYLYKKEKKRSA